MKEDDDTWDRITYVILPPEYVILVGSLGATVSLFNEVRCQPSYIYVFVYLSPLDSNCTICKYFCYSIWSLVPVI